MFFILQTHPEYIAKLTRLVTQKEIDGLLQIVMFSLYGNQYENREEHLLLSMFEVCEGERGRGDRCVKCEGERGRGDMCSVWEREEGEIFVECVGERGRGESVRVKERERYMYVYRM